VIKYGEEHGLKVSIVDSIRASEMEVRAEIIAIGIDEDVDGDQEAQSSLGTFAREAAAAHNDDGSAEI